MSSMQAATTAAGLLSESPSTARAVSNASLASRLDTIGSGVTRYGLAAVIGWIGAMKFTAYEAKAIEGLVSNSPLMAWVYNIFSVQGFGVALGLVLLSIALLIALKPMSARAAAVGAFLAVGMFGTTLSFMLSTPGVFEPSLGGFPALSVAPGQFLVKDAVLLGASIWLLADALKAIVRNSAGKMVVTRISRAR